MIHAQLARWKAYPRQRNGLAPPRPVGAIISLVTAVTLAPFSCAAELPAHQANLKTAAGPRFTVGVGVDYRIGLRPDDWELLTTQFGFVTPENCMKPAHVQSKEGAFRFAEADQFVEFATSHQLQIVGHCLVWAKHLMQ